MKKLLVILQLSIMTMACSTVVSARSDTSLQLSITPKLCIVDVTQDGTGQLLQTPSPDCQAALPTLIDPLASGSASPVFALPFAGRDQLPDNARPLPLIRPRVDGLFVPIASKADQASGDIGGERVAMAVTGVGLAVAAVAVGIDIALFELHYSRTLARWTKTKTTDRVFKR